MEVATGGIAVGAPSSMGGSTLVGLLLRQSLLRQVPRYLRLRRDDVELYVRHGGDILHAYLENWQGMANLRR